MDEEKLLQEKATIEKRKQATIVEIHQELEKYEDLGLESLTDAQKAFILARRSYLSPSQREKFEEILTPKVKEITLDELKERGAAVGVEYKPGTKKVDFQRMVEDAENKSE